MNIQKIVLILAAVYLATQLQTDWSSNLCCILIFCFTLEVKGYAYSIGHTHCSLCGV